MIERYSSFDKKKVVTPEKCTAQNTHVPVLLIKKKDLASILIMAASFSPQLFEHIQTHAMWSGSRTKLNTLENVNDLTCKSLKYKDMISGGWVY